MILEVVAAAVLAHPQGFHERVALSVSRQAVDGLLVMDVDSGEKAKLIRAGADFDHDGVISPAERGALQKKLVAMALGGLKLGLSGFPLTLKVVDVKMSTRDDHAALETGLSVAVLFEATVKSPIGEGVRLEVSAEAPDSSHVIVEVSAVTRADGGVVAVEKKDVATGEKYSVRLPAGLAPR